MKWLFLFLLLPFTASATNHYVSSSTGSDSNPGTISQPWQTIGKVNSAMSSFPSGDSVLFKKGDTFTIPEGINTGGLLVTVNGIVLSSYGTGAQPILTYPAVTGWSGSGVYTTSFTIQTCCSILFQDGVPLTKASSSACIDGNWYGASGVLYYKPTSGTPSNHTVTVANINNSYIPGIDLSGRQNVTITGLTFNSLGVGIKTFETTTGTSNLTITNCTFNLCQSGVFMMPGSGNNTGASITNNLFYRCQVGVRLYTIAAIGGSSTAGTHINCTVTGNEMSQIGTTDGTTHWQSSVAGTDYEAIGVQNFMGGTISNNNIHDGYCIGLSWYNISTRSSDNNVIQNNTIQNNLKGGMILIGAGTYNYSYNNNFFSNNLFVNTNGAPGNNDGTIAIYPGTLTTVQSKFVNNTLSGSLNNIAFENSNAPQFLILNNIFSNVGANNFVAYGYSTKPASLTMDYNLYYPTVNWILGSNKTLAQMQALGMEQHSLVVNPQLTSSYTLAPTSPAINAGTPVGLPYSGSAPDIGAYEYTATSPFCGTYGTSAPINLNGVSNRTITGLSITATTGVACITLTNCTNITIYNCILNGNTTPGQNVNQMGVSSFNSTGITVRNCLIKNTSRGVYFVSTTATNVNLKADSNQFQNMTGPVPAGQCVQINQCSGAGISISYNVAENLPGVSQPADMINIYKSNGTVSSPIIVNHNQLRQTGTTAASVSGGGILLADGGGTWQSASNNIAVNTGHFLFGCATGQNITITNNMGYLNDAISTNPIGIQAANVVTGTTCNNIGITGNQIYCFNPATGTQVPYWIPIPPSPNACTSVDTLSNNWHAPLSPLILPVILIPTCPTNKPVIAYSPNVNTYYLNAPISTLTPSNSGDPATSWAIVPSPSAGINFSTTSGQISGVPVALQPKTVYTVSAVNAGGQGSTQVTITVINNPPVISYSPNSQNCTQGVAITTMLPVNTGGSAVSYTCTPNLPTGLIFNTVTGQISGVPSVLSVSANYTITAFNSGGSSPTIVTIVVNPPAPAPPSISYNPDTLILPINVAITPAVPISVGGTVVSYSHTGTFPAGLSFDTSSGVLSGTPTVNSGQTTYTVTGTNISGSGNAPLVISVITVLPNPPAITYNPSTVALQINQPAANLIPNNTGGTASSWSANALPTGMVINSSTGIISGTPTVLTNPTPYTITATNTGGSGQFTVTISVVNTAPGPVIRVHGKKAIFVH